MRIHHRATAPVLLAALLLTSSARALEPTAEVRAIANQCGTVGTLWSPESERTAAYVNGQTVTVCSWGGCVALDIVTGATHPVATEELPTALGPAADPIPPGVTWALGGVALTIADPGSAEVLHSIDFSEVAPDHPCLDAVNTLRTDRLVAETSNCAGPAGASYLVDTVTGSVSPLGGPDFDSYDVQFVHLEGDNWAFVSSAGHGVIVLDIETGTIAQRVDFAEVYPRYDHDGSTMSAWGDQGPLLFLGPGATLVVVHGAPRSGLVTVIDRETWQVREHWALFECTP